MNIIVIKMQYSLNFSWKKKFLATWCLCISINRFLNLTHFFFGNFVCLNPLKEHSFWDISMTYIKSIKWILKNVTPHKSKSKLIIGFSSSERPYNTRTKCEGTFQLHIPWGILKPTLLDTRFKSILYYFKCIFPNICEW